MNADEAVLLRRGLELARTYLDEGHEAALQDADQYANDTDLPKLVQSFVYVGLSSVELVATVEGVSVSDVIRRVQPRSDVTLLTDLPVGPWSKIIELADAVNRSNDEARRLNHGMDVPRAVNASFRFAISALSYVVSRPSFAGRSEVEIIDVLLEGLRQPGAVDGE